MPRRRKAPPPENAGPRVAESLTKARDALVAARGTPLRAGEHRYPLSKDDGGGAKGKVAKGSLISSDPAQHSNVLPSNDDVHTLFTMAGALFPPYDPEVLLTLWEHSNSLRPNVDAYAANIDSFGYKLEPVIDLTAPDSTEKIGDAIYLERLRAQEVTNGTTPQAEYPKPDEIENRRKEIAALMRIERARLETFFDFCCADTSLTELRQKTRQDREIMGNGYWEVLRNGEGKVAQFVYVPGYSVRLLPIEHRHHEYKVQQRISPIEYQTVVMRKRFRRFIQVVLDRVVHFKEFGDPRCISRKNGKEYANEDELRKADEHDGPATELVHFKVFSSRSPYGIPRWIGVLLAVLGSRASEEVNFLYFDNKAVPPLAILVSGGKIAASSVSKIESYVKDNLKGKENFHRILIVEAEPSAPGGGLTENGRCRISLEPLAQAQQQDALFQNYDERNIDKVGMAFRQPRLLRGDVRDFNRATADAALQFTETQVFQPERQNFDDFVNRHILTDMGIRFWTFVSQSPVNRDPAQVTEMATAFAQAGAFTPNELREMASEVFNKPFRKIEEEWGDQPFPLTLQGILPAELGAPAATSTPGAPGKASPSDQRLQAIAANLVNLKATLKRAEEEAFQRLLKNAKGTEGAGTVTLRVPKAVIDSWIEPADAAAE